MSYPVNLQALPGEVIQEVFTPENMRGRRFVSSLNQLTFPKSRLALWDGSPVGETLRLQLYSHRKPQIVLLEKALRLAQRHARRSHKLGLQCFFLGSVAVNEDEEGVTVTLDRFDPGRDQAGATDRVPSALLPGDVLVPCLFSAQSETSPYAVVMSEAELHHCFKALQQAVSSRQTLDLSQLLKIRAHVIYSQTSDAATFNLSWSSVCPAVGLDVQPVRAVPIIPTALLRSLTSIGRPAQPAGRQRGFLTMDQTRKLVLLLESDPKASSLPLVGLWLSGVTHVYSPQVWAWSLRFMFGSALQDRVLSEMGSFLLVVFGSTHRAPQFFQCRVSQRGSGPQLDFQLLTSSQSVTLYQQVAPVDGRALRCELDSEDHSRQAEIFRAAQSSFNRTPPPAAGLSVSDQDSGVEDEDFSPRPSPSPHPPAPQVRRVQPSVPELSLLIESSFSSNHNVRTDSGSAHRPPPANWKSASPPSSSSTTSSAPKPAPVPPPPNLHSTPNSNPQQTCSCCSTNNCTSIFPSPALPTAATPHFHQQTHFSPQSAPPPSHSHQKSVPLSSQNYATQPSTPPVSSYQQTPPPFSRHSAPTHPSTKLPSTPIPSVSRHQQTPLSNHKAPPPPPSSHKRTPPLSSRHTAPSPHCTFKKSPPPSGLHSISSSSHHQTPASSSPHEAPVPPYSPQASPALPQFHQCVFPPSLPSCSPQTVLQPPPSDPHNYPPLVPKRHSPPPPVYQPTYSCSHTPPAPPCHGDSSSPHPSSPATDLVSPWPMRPQCGNPCCEKMGGLLTTDPYQLLLHQDQQLRLLQAQVQMLLEAQGRLQPSARQVETQTSKSTASIAVETGASLFWGQASDQPLLQEEPEPQPPFLKPKPSSRSPPSSSCSTSTSSHDLSMNKPEEGEHIQRRASCSSSDPHSVSGLQSPVLGESVSMYRPPEEQQSFYKNLMTQLSTRLQDADGQQEAKEDRRWSLSVSELSQSSQRSSSQRRQDQKKEQRKSPEGDDVIRATLRRLQQLGVEADDLKESDENEIKAVEMASTLATINPAAVVSRLSVSEPTVSALFPGGSVDLSLEANAIALRYLSQSQLSRLSLGGHAPQTIPVPSSSSESLLSPSNMSLATRRYMRRYGLIEEDGEEEEEEEKEKEKTIIPEVRQPLTEALNVKLLPQSQLIRDLRPKMQLLAVTTKPDSEDKENCSGRRAPIDRMRSQQPEGSVGNILDLSRLRELPKLF
ncbi:SCL-interrupting locus protein homolog isoform X1 [Cyprinodon tularosa]|uniref:SCL-interrupting locus protein homolog isoform X1 n=1 Tax=Cyprinodon tularosa TaxID=77115 RepID=UPI0018E276F2|nr:SCL-interrupting locus protein homolog isoform X1 [Cyprinodon tularosa]